MFGHWDFLRDWISHITSKAAAKQLTLSSRTIDRTAPKNNKPVFKCLFIRIDWKVEYMCHGLSPKVKAMFVFLFLLEEYCEAWTSQAQGEPPLLCKNVAYDPAHHNTVPACPWR